MDTDEKTIEFESTAVDAHALSLLVMRGRDEVSRLYEVELELRPKTEEDAANVDPALLLDAPACVAFRFAGTEAERIWGIVRALESVPSGVANVPTYRVLLVPRVWRATQMFRSRIFQNLTVPEIVLRVLRGLGLGDGDLRVAIAGTYPKREYTVQYEETDFDFICRLMEDEGIHFFFEHGEECETLVLGDTNDSFRRVPIHDPVHFRERGMTTSTEECVSEIHAAMRLVPRAVQLVDYNWRTPSLDLDASCDIPGAGPGVYMTGSQHFEDQRNGERLARVRAEEIASRQIRFRGTTTLRSLRAGDVFRLEDHTAASYDRSYVVLSIAHSVSQRDGEDGSAYTNEIEAIDLSTIYRPERVTPKPRVHGITYATIDGPGAATAAPLDDQGRYKVILPFDLDAVTGGHATRWIRRAQPLSGPGYGMHFPLREGAEVILAHVDGDPDRPIIVGAVPNTQTPTTVVKQNATSNTIKTFSGIRVEFEDDARRGS